MEHLHFLDKINHNKHEISERHEGGRGNADEVAQWGNVVAQYPLVMWCSMEGCGNSVRRTGARSERRGG